MLDILYAYSGQLHVTSTRKHHFLCEISRAFQRQELSMLNVLAAGTYDITNMVKYYCKAQHK